MNNDQKQSGAAVLGLTLALLITTTIVTLFSAGFGAMEQRLYANEYRTKQTLEAGDAGTEYGIAYLEAHQDTIVVDADNDGYIDPYADANTHNVALSNGSVYSIQYLNPMQNNLEIISINATGTSSDNTTSRQMQQIVKFRSTVAGMPGAPVYAKGGVELTGNSTIFNADTEQSIVSGGNITFQGSSGTEDENGIMSDQNTTGSDIDANNAEIQAMTNDEFFSTFFGVSEEIVKANAQTGIYTTAANISSVINGIQGKLIWAEPEGGLAHINSNTVVGSIDNPVVLVINGDLKLNGGAEIYGFVYVIGNVELGAGTALIVGSIAVGGSNFDTVGSIDSSGTIDIVYSPQVLTNIGNQVGEYSKVAASWRDF